MAVRLSCSVHLCRLHGSKNILPQTQIVVGHAGFCQSRRAAVRSHPGLSLFARAPGSDGGAAPPDDETASPSGLEDTATASPSPSPGGVAILASKLASAYSSLLALVDSLPPYVRNFPWPLVASAALEGQESLFLRPASLALLPAVLLCSLGEVAAAADAGLLGWAVFCLGVAVAASHWAWQAAWRWAEGRGYPWQQSRTPQGIAAYLHDLQVVAVLCAICFFLLKLLAPLPGVLRFSTAFLVNGPLLYCAVGAMRPRFLRVF